ncbi:uncharacterized protein C8orf48 homolog isoform X1 [Bufo gargarizans]|uniref:uncharacterized protein C8orf48 homolog isoform X1 n=1 Tax=Bufo gargarizans TaxID=30331 RepID=UPI001CF454FF|nr:uncharacterized protein C8orf48 homolog isoform X1 [Bufo gargarizans]
MRSCSGSDPLSGASGYSGESFESSTDGSDGRYTSDAFDSITNENTEKYPSESFESCAGETSRLQRHDSLTDDSGRDYESESFESLSSEIDVHQTYSSENSYIESASAEDDHKESDQGKGLIEKWIKTLVDGTLQPNNSFRHPLKTVASKESTTSESKALQSYCSLKIEHLHQLPKSHRQRRGQPPTHPTKTKDTQPSFPVPRALMNRLELQRTKEAVNQVMKAEMHDPAACPNCCNKKAELAQYQFIRMKKTKLEADLLHKKLEECMYSKDLVTCIGEIHQSLPKPSEEQTTIWQRLYMSAMKT